MPLVISREWVYVGMMEKKMETTILCLVFRVGLYEDNRKNGSYYSIFGLYIGVIWGYWNMKWKL